MSSLQLGGARTIDEVIEQMDEIIAWSISEKSRLGYFAALYRKVTVKVREGIYTDEFENGPRMERLDVVFANRYLEALGAYLNGRPTSKSWEVAFEQAGRKQPIILQHLLLGMNAHINLDLGIAAAQVCPGAEIKSLYGDFMRINNILSSLVDEVEAEISELSPWIGLLDRIDPRVADAVVNFSMQKARDAAWEFAQHLAPLQVEEQVAAIKWKDEEVALLARIVARPPSLLFRMGLRVIAWRESSDVRKNIEVLNRALPGSVIVEQKSEAV